MKKITKIIVAILAVVSFIVESIFIVLWATGGLEGVAKGIIVTLIFIILGAWIIFGIIMAAILMRGENLEEKKITWGTKKCITWAIMYIRLQMGEEIDPRCLRNTVGITTTTKDKYPIFMMKFSLKNKKQDYTMVARTDEIDGKDLKLFDILPTHNQELIDKAIEKLCPEKPKITRVHGRKIDSVTGTPTEETSRTEESYEDEKLDLMTKEGEK